MKKIFTLITIFVVSLLNAQVFSEDFSDGVPGQMNEVRIAGNLSWKDCEGDLGGIPCPGGVATFYNGTTSPYNTALDTPPLDLSSGVYKVAFTLAKREKSGNVNEFYLEISTDGGETFAEVQSIPEEIAEPSNFAFVLTQFSLTNETVIRFRTKNTRGYGTYLDNISVKEVLGDDLGIANINIPSLIVSGPTEVRGTLANYGINPITSFDINWSVNGGEAHTQQYTGQNIASGQSFNFTHQDIWDAAPGESELRVWVSNMDITDTDPDNDEMIRQIEVASGMSLRVPIFERFTSSTCPPCRPYNEGTFDPFYNSYAHDLATFVSYQVNWPGAGDPYYTAEVGQRRNLYGVTAAPSIFLDAVNLNLPSQPSLKVILDTKLAEEHISFFDIEANHEIDGTNITVDADIIPYLDGSFNAIIVVFEKDTFNNTGGNGETEFHHVFMKALPDMSGTPLTLVQGETQHLSFTHNMSNTNVEEMDDLAVAIILQDMTTLEIINTRYTEESNIPLGTNDFTYSNNVELAPNPTSGLVRVFTEKPVDVRVYDLTGKALYKQNAVSNNTQMNLSHLSKGVYVVTLTDDKGLETVRKLIIK